MQAPAQAVEGEANTRSLRWRVAALVLVSTVLLGVAHCRHDSLPVRAPKAQVAVAPSESRPSAPFLGAQPCPAEMVLVSGQYCPKVETRCLHWLDDSKLPFARCGTYASPSQCLADRVPMRFCVDREEYTPAGDSLPLNFASFAKATAVCARLARRTCSEDEWNFACEGEEIRPYPYGFVRRPLCNQDQLKLYQPHLRWQVLLDLREPSAARPDCLSPFGVHDMVGNLDEPVRRESSEPGFTNALKGGWWMPARNRCRAATTAHGDHYQGIQIGVRCCADVLEL